ncbi:MAG: hypothetical protein HY875_05345 [Chloroflexi bacterium]|nr:hypothetical protein [Chloroflexota bacterium]
METLLWLVAAWAAAFLANLAPAFAPANWMVLSFFRIAGESPFWPLTIGGAAAAAAGRLCLGLLARQGSRYLPRAERENAEALARWFERGGFGRTLFVVVYTIGPFPSNLLFIAAGAGRARLLPIALIFFAGRAVTDTFWVWVTTTTARRAADQVIDSSTSWPSILLQFASLLLVVAVFRLPWAKWLRRARKGGK